MVSKLPQKTLDRLPEGSRTALQQVILSGQKDNFRVLVNEILSGNAEKSLEEINGIIDLLDDNFRESFIQKIVDSIKNHNVQHIKIFSSLVKIGKINNHILNKIFDELFEHIKKYNFVDNIKIIIVLLESGQIDTDKINTFFKTIMSSKKLFSNSIISLFLKTGVIDEEGIFLFNKYFINNFTGFFYNTCEVVNTGKVNKMGIKKINDTYEVVLNDLEKNNKNYSIKEKQDKINILSSFLKTGKIYKRLIKKSKFILDIIILKNGLDDRFTLDFLINKFPDLIENLNISKKYLNSLFDLSINDYDYKDTQRVFYSYILPIILKSKKINKKRFSKFKSLFFDQIECFINGKSYNFFLGEETFPKIIDLLELDENDANKYFDIMLDFFDTKSVVTKHMLPSLIKTGKVSQEKLNKLFIDIIGKLDSNGEIHHIIITMLDIGKISDENLTKLRDTIFNFIKSGKINNNIEEILPFIVQKIELSKEQERLLNSYFQNALTKHKIILIESGKIKLFEEKDEKKLIKTKEKYPINYLLFRKIYEKVISYDDDFKIFNYLKTIFLQIEKLEALNKFLSYEINEKFFIQNFEKILKLSETKSLEFGYFKLSIIYGEKISENFLINKRNFLGFLSDNEPLLEFEKDKGIDFEIRPWTKKWFLENLERENYLNKDKIKTFEKFGTIIALGLIEGSQNVESVKKFYEHIFSQIKYSTNRTSILQLGEVFNLILKQESYEIFNDLIPGVGDYFRSFIEDYNISDKGRTILTLMIVREIKDSFQIFGEEGKQQVDYAKLEEMIKRVYEKLKMYRGVIDKYKDLPIQTSIGMEYEVTESIAKGYKEEIGSDYKNDIVILSEYSGVANGNDAVHEIATRPTNNPYLLVLEMKLLNDLDFVDLNFKRGDYARGSRGLHITLGGEFGIEVNIYTNFIQNILIAGNLGGVNVGKEVEDINIISSIREKGGDCETLFGEEKTECTEFRALSIDKKEQFERLILSIFNLNMVYQIVDKFDLSLTKMINNLGDIDFNAFVEKMTPVIEKPISKIEIKLIYEFLTLVKDIKKIIENHEKNFQEQESLNIGNNKSLEDLLMILTSTSPLIQIFQKSGVDIYYFRGLFEAEIDSGFTIENQNDFENILKGDGKSIDGLSARQMEILYLGYKVQVRKLLSKLKNENKEIYDNIGEYLNGNIEYTIRKITNRKRFEEVIASTGMNYEEYMKSLVLPGWEEIFEEISPEHINIFTRINNLFIKKDSTNALSMYDNTREENGEIVSDRRLTETTIFDKVEMGLSERFGHYIIQGASENMLTQAIQARILEFNKRVS